MYLKKPFLAENSDFIYRALAIYRADVLRFDCQVYRECAVPQVNKIKRIARHPGYNYSVSTVIVYKIFYNYLLSPKRNYKLESATNRDILCWQLEAEVY